MPAAGPPDERAAGDRPYTRAALVAIPFDDELVVYDEDAHTVHYLNATATFIWRLCDGTHSVADIVDHVVRAYALDRGTARTDVTDCIAGLRETALLEGATAAAP
jgi:hypothetical protein